MLKPLACLLGSAPALARAELEMVLGMKSEQPYPSYCIFPEVDTELLPALQARLGGTVKLVSLEQKLVDSSAETATDAIAAYLQSLNLPKLNFGLGEWGRDHLPVLSIFPIKQKLQESGIKVRFAEDSRAGLSTALLSHREVVEIIVLGWGEATWIGQTRTVSQPDEWSTRDRGKPYADHTKGLLPPKVARMMVNLATGSVPLDEIKQSDLLFDPFCGSATVLMEARTLGITAVGSDLDPEAVAGARKNLDWQAAREGLENSAQLQTGDVTRVSWPQKVRWIVTEPFLGKPKPRPDDVPNMFRGLEKMYWGAFRHWTSVLESGGEVVIVFPAVQVGKIRYSLKNLIDKLEPLGYTIVSESWSYHRPGAIVEREIHHFRYVTR
jgi:tRNA G10  N-methylase Trm11